MAHPEGVVMEANAPIGRVSSETRQQLTSFILHRKIKSSLYLEVI